MKKPVSPNKEYVLVYDHKTTHGLAVPEIVVPQDTVVVNVHNVEHGMLEYTVKETGKKYETHYGYMFAENTEDNLKLLALYRQSCKEYSKAKKDMEDSLNRVTTVAGPFEGFRED